MITRHMQRIKNRRGNGFGTSESHLYRLSAAMVELSLGHNQLDSPTDIPPTFPIKPKCNPGEAKVQFSANIAATTEQQENKAAQPHRSGLQASRELLRECISRISGYGVNIYSWLESRAKVQFSANIAAATEQQENKAAQLHHRGLQASRELLRICTSRISDYGVKIYSSLKSRMRFLAVCSAATLLTLLAFSVVYAVRRHHQDSVKSQSQIPAAVQQRDGAPVSSSASQQTHDDAHTVAPNKAKSRRRQGDYIAKDTYVYYGKDGKPSH